MADLVRQVDRAMSQAAAENARRDELASWTARDAERDDRNRASFFGDVVSDVEEFFDPRPATPPVVPDAKSLGQYEGGFSVPIDYVPAVPGVGGSVPDRIDDRRLDDRLPGLLDDLHDTEYVWW